MMLLLSTFVSLVLAISTVDAGSRSRPYRRDGSLEALNATIGAMKAGNSSDPSGLKDEAYTEFPPGLDPPLDIDGDKVFYFFMLYGSPHLEVKFFDWVKYPLPRNDRTGAISTAQYEAERVQQPSTFLTNRDYEWQSHYFAATELHLSPEKPVRYEQTAAIGGLTWTIWQSFLKNAMMGFNQAYPDYWVKFEIYVTNYAEWDEHMIAQGALRKIEEGVTAGGQVSTVATS